MVLLLAELRMKVVKVISVLTCSVLLNGRLDNAQPKDRNGFMVAAGGLVRNVIGGVVSADAVAQFVGGGLVPVPSEIKICQFYVRAMVPFSEGKCARFELLDEIVVSHRVVEPLHDQR